MNKNYLLKNALKHNPTGKKYNAIASKATFKEIQQHKDFFHFDFMSLSKIGIIYKICKEGDEDNIQGLVCFKPELGVLDCINMETSYLNKFPLNLHNGVGKVLIALCCLISFDLNLDGFITFKSKNKLMPYYKRYGALNISGLIMYIDTKNAKKLIDCFK
jgi:hypothetical protein